MRTQLVGSLALLLAVGVLLGHPASGRAQVNVNDLPSGYPTGSSNFSRSSDIPPAPNVATIPTTPAPAVASQTVPAGCWFGRCRPPMCSAPDCAGGYPWYANANPYWNNYYYYSPYNGGGAPYAPSYPSFGGGGGCLPNLPDVPAEEAPGHPDGVQGPPVAIHKDCVWIEGEYVASWIKPMRFPTPLVTFGTEASTKPGALGEPGTTTAFGDKANFGMFSGVRLDGGLGLDDCGLWALELSGLVTIPEHVRFAVQSDAAGNPIIGRPIFNTATGQQGVILNSETNIATGGVALDVRSQFLGAEANLRRSFQPYERLRIDGLVGFRFLRLAETLTIRDNTEPLTPGAVDFLGSPAPLGSKLTDEDSFRTTNHFYGLQIGSDVRYEWKCLFVSAFGKVALGATDQQAEISGSTSLNSPTGMAAASGGGALALASNIGQHNQTVLDFVPEAGLTVGVNVAPWCRLTAGYSFLYWNSVLRPGGQINPVVNPSLIPSSQSFGKGGGPLQPSYQFNSENYWTQSLFLGVDFHY